MARAPYTLAHLRAGITEAVLLPTGEDVGEPVVVHADRMGIHVQTYPPARTPVDPYPTHWRVHPSTKQLILDEGPLWLDSDDTWIPQVRDAYLADTLIIRGLPDGCAEALKEMMPAGDHLFRVTKRDARELTLTRCSRLERALYYDRDVPHLGAYVPDLPKYVFEYVGCTPSGWSVAHRWGVTRVDL